ncbi:hypothetical protein DFH09DRAFT_1374890 [Mycena vulgaris]|nr:hypothetical protein DFH09DRAFT_1374890 [Mycena vulgaris]
MALPTSPRKIIICFDGTANSQKTYTNVLHLHSILSSENQKVLYLPGIGTEEGSWIAFKDTVQKRRGFLLAGVGTSNAGLQDLVHRYRSKLCLRRRGW